MLKYRNMDHALRGLVLEGAGVEAHEAHPSWSSPTDQGVYAELVLKLDDVLAQRRAGPMASGEDLLQEVLATGDKVRLAGEKMHRKVFRRPARVLTTLATPLWVWLQRMALDQARRKVPQPPRVVAQDAPALWNVLQNEIVEGTKLGTKLLHLMLDAVPGQGVSAECLRALVRELTVNHRWQESHQTMTDFCLGFGISSSGVVRSQRALEAGMLKRVESDPQLQKEIERAYSRWVRPEVA